MKNWKIAVAVMAVLAACVMLACGGIVLMLVMNNSSMMMDAELRLPSEVQAGEQFAMEVRITNPHAEAVVLDSIDIDNPLLDGFQVVSVEPAASHTDTIPFLDQRTWAFGETLGPGEELTVTYTLKPVEAGHFTGNVDVCNPAQDFKSLYADIIVREE